jgi:hypothetical protein
MRPYPAWVAAIAVDHPELTLGFDVSTVVTAAGIVEFGLAFALLWTRDLKAYRLAPSEKRKASLMARFDRIFTRQTGFVTLDRLLKRLHANKAELLKVLERPEIPLHTNGSENDIRSHVTNARLAAAPAAMSVAIAAMDSLASPRPAKNWESSSGIISAHASASPASLMSRAWPRWSSTDAHRPNQLGLASPAVACRLQAKSP